MDLLFLYNSKATYVSVKKLLQSSRLTREFFEIPQYCMLIFFRFLFLLPRSIVLFFCSNATQKGNAGTARGDVRYLGWS
jgi:hypothetical protein